MTQKQQYALAVCLIFVVAGVFLLWTGVSHVGAVILLTFAILSSMMGFADGYEKQRIR